MTNDTQAERREKVILKLPQIEIGPTDGFTDENDLFSYEKFGVRVANVFRDSDGLNVALLDDDWGMGKTTFALQWAGLMRGLGHHVIYIDAFANDFHQDPFLMLVSEIKDAFPEQAKDLVKNAIKIGSAIGLKVASGGLISRDDIEKSIEDHLSKVKKDKETVKKFENNLKELAGDKEKPVIIIIDELDRCRPDFALRLLERIKHFFSVGGISFLLIANMKQLSAMVRHSYGVYEDGARVYLEKFYDVHLKLPDEIKDKTKVEKYIDYLSEEMKISGGYDKEFSLQRVQLVRLMKEKEFSLRNVEKIATHVALIIAGRICKGNAALPFLITGLLIIKNQDPDLYEDILRMNEDMLEHDVLELSNRVESALLLDRFGPYGSTTFGDISFKAFWLYMFGREIAEAAYMPEDEMQEFRKDIRKEFNDEFYYGLGIHGNRKGMEFKILPSLARRIDGLLGM